MPFYTGIQVLEKVWEDVIMTDDITYLVNDTQGLHVNMSYGGQDKQWRHHFIDIWLTLEPVIVKNLPIYRQNSEYALPLTSKKYRRSDKYIVALEKYVAVSLRNPGRIEVRIYQGTMDIAEIIDWTAFCVQLLAIAIIDSRMSYDEIFELLPANLQRFILL